MKCAKRSSLNNQRKYITNEKTKTSKKQECIVDKYKKIKQNENSNTIKRNTVNINLPIYDRNYIKTVDSDIKIPSSFLKESKDKNANDEINRKRMEYRFKGKNSLSKSVADYKTLINGSMTPQIILQNEYGLNNKGELNYIKTNQDRKTIGILKILLNHYIRKTINNGSFSSTKPSPFKTKHFSNSKERIATKVCETPEITGINEENKNKNSVSVSLRNKFCQNKRRSAIPSNDYTSTNNRQTSSLLFDCNEVQSSNSKQNILKTCPKRKGIKEVELDIHKLKEIHDLNLDKSVTPYKASLKLEKNKLQISTDNSKTAYYNTVRSVQCSSNKHCKNKHANIEDIYDETNAIGNIKQNVKRTPFFLRKSVDSVLVDQISQKDDELHDLSTKCNNESNKSNIKTERRTREARKGRALNQTKTMTEVPITINRKNIIKINPTASSNDNLISVIPSSNENIQNINMNNSADIQSPSGDIIEELDNLRIRLRSIFRSISQAKSKDS